MIPIKPAEYEKLKNYIKENYGINLGREKQPLVVGRLGTTLAQLGFATFSDYYEYIVSDTSGEAAVRLIDKISTNHTYFMREPEHFEFYRNALLPYWESSIKDRDLRVWSAGCSSGEEPYTLAMLNADYFSGQANRWDTGLLATDISTQALAKAISGAYPATSVEKLPPDWVRKYFRPHGPEYVVCDNIKNNVTIRRFNLMEDRFPFKRRFHAIFCRNVMIYFDEATRSKLIQRFYENLEPGGYLFIGHTETIARGSSGFAYVRPAVYRKD